jgi:hypothetical protein
VYLAKHDPALLKRRTEAGHFARKGTNSKSRHGSSVCRVHRTCRAAPARRPLWLVERTVVYLHLRRRACGSFVLSLLSRIESEHLRRRKYPRRRRVESDLDRDVRISPASDVFRSTVPAHRDSTRARIVVDAAFDPDLSADPCRSHLNEEKVLMRDLPGYVEYQNKVATRLIAFIW